MATFSSFFAIQTDKPKDFLENKLLDKGNKHKDITDADFCPGKERSDLEGLLLPEPTTGQQID